MKYLYIGIIFILCFTACKRECVYTEPNRIMAIKMADGNNVSYWHYVVVENLYSSYIDSVSTLNILNNYIRSTDEKPVRVISLLNKVEDFDKGESLSQPRSFFRNILIDVYFDTLTYKPERFIFYNGYGSEGYKSNKWDY